MHDLITALKDAPLGPFSGADWRAACAALDLSSPVGMEYPTLRQVCRKLAM
jgi:hypothetical protein